MILKRAWTGKDGKSIRPSLMHAMEGLFPFMMLDFNEDAVAQINDEDNLLNYASLVSIKDLKALGSNVNVFTEADDFLLMLK